MSRFFLTGPELYSCAVIGVGGYYNLDLMPAFYLSRFTGCTFSEALIYFTIKSYKL